MTGWNTLNARSKAVIASSFFLNASTTLVTTRTIAESTAVMTAIGGVTNAFPKVATLLPKLENALPPFVDISSIDVPNLSSTPFSLSKPGMMLVIVLG